MFNINDKVKLTPHYKNEFRYYKNIDLDSYFSILARDTEIRNDYSVSCYTLTQKFPNQFVSSIKILVYSTDRYPVLEKLKDGEIIREPILPEIAEPADQYIPPSIKNYQKTWANIDNWAVNDSYYELCKNIKSNSNNLKYEPVDPLNNKSYIPKKFKEKEAARKGHKLTSMFRS